MLLWIDEIYTVASHILIGQIWYIAGGGSSCVYCVIVSISL